MQRNLRTDVVLAVAIAVALAACSRNESQAESAAAPAPAIDAGGMARAEQKRVADDAPTEQQMTSSAATYTDAQRKFIRTARVQFRVADVYRSALAIEDVAAAQGGFVTKNDIAAHTGAVQRRPKGEGMLLELAEYTLRGEVTVRVPSDKTQDFLRAIVSQIEFLDSRDFEAMDAQFQLLRQQLAFRRAQETQRGLDAATGQGGKLGHKVEAISAQNDAKSARDEALVVQKEFEDRIAFSTITLSLYQAPRILQTELTDVEAVFEQNSPGLFARLGSSLKAGWHGAVNLLIELAKLWPLWLAAIVAILGYRKFFSRTRL